MEPLQFAKEVAKLAKLSPLETKLIRRLIEEGPQDTGDLLTFCAEKDYSTTDGSLRQGMDKIRKKLKRFYSTPEGMKQGFRLNIPSARHVRKISAEILNNEGPPDAGSFWKAHLSNGLSTCIVLSQWTAATEDELDHLVYGRKRTNVPTRRRLVAAPGSKLAATARLVDLQDAQSMASLLRYFENWSHARIGHAAPEIMSADYAWSRRNANRVFLGSSQFDDNLNELDCYLFFPAQMVGEKLEVTRQDGTKKSLSPASNREVLVLVSRTPQDEEGAVTTLINGPRTDAVAAVAKLLTDDTQFRRTVLSRIFEGVAEFPGHFQLGFSVRLSKNSRTVGKVSLLEYFTGEVYSATRRLYGLNSVGHLNGSKINFRLGIPLVGKATPDELETEFHTLVRILRQIRHSDRRRLRDGNGKKRNSSGHSILRG